MRKLKNTELNRKSIEEFKKADKTPAIVVLDKIRRIHRNKNKNKNGFYLENIDENTDWAKALYNYIYAV